ncbi:putative ABC transport system permease protein [Actinomadura meyerae]|uniref:Putative ABC transport system permease protein n=1 Tax=Actinomadura meyerae TaxID=240840 RepID=A0A239JLK0_9ACTN|nr:FtsX-like permease family protein [Actinomadura meyerae]SNT06183.1 putative ABC transport system permease protein [Actinomadura meyerae]
MRGTALRLARAQWAPLAALAVLSLLSALLAVAVPARTAAGYDRAAAAAAGADADIRIEGKAQGGEAWAAVPSQAALEGNNVTWQQMLPASLRAAAGEPEASVTAERMPVEGEFDAPRLLYLSWDLGAFTRLRLVAGTRAFNPPTESSGDIRILVAERYAEQLGYKVGDRITVRGVTVRITGLYEPVNAADPFWSPRARMLHPVKESLGGDGTEADAGTALLDAGGYSRLAREGATQFTFSWRFPIRVGAVGADDAAAMAADLDALRSAVRGRAGFFSCDVVTALDDRLGEFAGRLHTAKSVLGLALGGLAAVAAGALLLAAGLLGDRLRPVLGTMRARGASLRQIAAPAVGLTALATVPAALLGYGAGRLLDAGPPQPVSACAVAALVLAALLVSAAMVWRERGGGLGSVADRRDDLVSARPSARRLVLDALLVVLAVIGVVLLRRRGASAGTDPLVAAVPVLLGAALGVLVLRGYPYLLRAAGPLLRRRSGAVAFLGVARASRQSLVGALPLAVLLLAATVAGFTATVDTALRDGQARASWSDTGGDARIEAGPVDDAALARIRALPGVRGALPARIITGVSSTSDPAPLTLVGVDLDAYRDLAPGVPDLPSGDGVYLSPLAARTLGTGKVTLARPGMSPVEVKPAGQIEHFPGQGPGTAFALVPYKLIAGEKGFPSQVFVTGDVDARALRAAAPGRDVRLRRDVEKAMTDAPLVTVVHETFRDGALIGGAYGLLAVLLVLVVGARARGRTVAHLRALGLSRRQSRGLALVEIAPVLVCAVGAGWVLGLLLPEITGPVVDLRPYTGGFAVTAHTPGLPALLGLAGALLLAAAAAVAVDRLFDTRPGTVLRTGD